jgi:hypothetical protein
MTRGATRESGSTSQKPRVELYVRSLAPTEARDQQERVVARLQSLDDRDELRAVETVLCGDCVCPSLATADTDIGEHLLGRYRAFEEWAADHDRELVGFERRDTQSLLTNTSVTGIVFPRLALAEYRNGRPTYVAPSANGTDTTSVADRLDTYA